MGRKMKDITGQRFGRGVAIEPTDKRCGHNVVWRVKCDCGNEYFANVSHLISGQIQSCGCLRKEKMSKLGKAAAKDITNQTFGQLTALEPTDKRNGGKIVWRCRCSCGNIVEVSINNLTCGRTTSCGCIKSLGEEEVSRLLREKNILFKQQFTDDRFRREKTQAKFRFDFALLDGEDRPIAFIEYNGQQHYQFANSGWNTEENFLETVDRDREKAELCDKYNIPLYIIRYDEDIQERLEQILKNIEKADVGVC